MYLTYISNEFNLKKKSYSSAFSNGGKLFHNLVTTDKRLFN